MFRTKAPLTSKPHPYDNFLIKLSISVIIKRIGRLNVSTGEIGENVRYRVTSLAYVSSAVFKYGYLGEKCPHLS